MGTFVIHKTNSDGTENKYTRQIAVTQKDLGDASDKSKKAKAKPSRQTKKPAQQ